MLRITQLSQSWPDMIRFCPNFTISLLAFVCPAIKFSIPSMQGKDSKHQFKFGNRIKKAPSFKQTQHPTRSKRSKTARQQAAITKMKNSRINQITASQDKEINQFLQNQCVKLQFFLAQIEKQQEKVLMVVQAVQVARKTFFIKQSQRPKFYQLNNVEYQGSNNQLKLNMDKPLRNTNHQELKGLLLKTCNSLSQDNFQKDDQGYQNNYIHIIKEIVTKEKQAQNICINLLQKFKNSFRHSQKNYLWQILAHQFSAYNSLDIPATNAKNMLISSLKLMRQEFSRRLQFLNQLQETKESKRIQQGALWPKVWAAYCAGQAKEFNTLLNDGKRDKKMLCELYQLTQQGIGIGQPEKHSYHPNSQIKDDYYRQLIFCLNGEFHQTSALSGDFCLEQVFIAVRTLGIFYENHSQKFQQKRTKIVNKYKCKYQQFGPNEQMVRNMLYLLDYSTIVEMGPNRIINLYDYVHYLLVLSNFSDLLTNVSFKSVLTKTLAQFIKLLFSQRKPQYIYYIKFLPKDKLVQITSSFIFSVDGLDTFDWQGLKDLVQENQFKQIIAKTTKKYDNVLGKQLKSVLVLLKFTQDYEKALNLLINICINYHLNKGSHSQKVAVYALNLGLAFSKRKQDYALHHMVFQLAEQFRKILLLIKQKDGCKIMRYIPSCKFVYLDFSKDLHQDFIKMLDQKNFLDFYFYFLRLIVVAEKVFSDACKGSKKQKQWLKCLDKRAKQILLMSSNKANCTKQHFKTLIQQLQLQFSQPR